METICRTVQGGATLFVFVRGTLLVGRPFPVRGRRAKEKRRSTAPLLILGIPSSNAPQTTL